MSDFTITENPTSLDPAEVIELYSQVGWGKRQDYDEAKVATMLANSTYVAVAKKPNGQLLGLVRALSDGVETTWLTEIIVAPDYQRKGLGMTLVKLVLRCFATTAIFLETFSDHQTFFEKCGFKTKREMIVCSRAAQKD